MLLQHIALVLLRMAAPLKVLVIKQSFPVQGAPDKQDALSGSSVAADSPQHSLITNKSNKLEWQEG